jgi:NADH-ubiquinone oxidoreductase chain 4
MVLARESVFIQVIFLDFFLLLLLFSLLCSIVLLEELACILFIYIFFESRLIPTLFLILCWGYQPEQVQAGIYLLFYTLLASVGSTAHPSFSKDRNDFEVSVKESETIEHCSLVKKVLEFFETSVTI